MKGIAAQAVTYLMGVSAVGAMIELTGGGWDISWHIAQRPETFLTPPHIVLYSGALFTLLGTAITLIFGRKSLQGKVMRALSIATVGIAAQLTAGGLDNWWHNAFGLDDSFSPPHILLISGMVVATFGVILSIKAFHYFSGGEESKKGLLWIFQAIGFGAFWFSVWGLFWVLSYPGFYREKMLPEIWERLTVGGIFTFIPPFVALTSAMIIGRRGSATLTFLVGAVGIHMIDLLMGELSIGDLVSTPILILPGVLADVLSPRTLRKVIALGLILSLYGFFQSRVVISMIGVPFSLWEIFLPVFVLSSLVAAYVSYLISLRVNRWVLSAKTQGTKVISKYSLSRIMKLP